ncbi:MAG: zinc-binding alcohol dehydrogenase [Desulfobacterales bacterium]
MKRQALIFAAPFEIDIAEEILPEPAATEVLIQTRFSAVSHGTEMLIYRGLFPADTIADETIPELRRPLSYPMKYGYAVVGDVIEAGSGVSRDLIGQAVFCLHPHESCFTADADTIIPVPVDIDPLDALFLANMETAVNLLMDGRPAIGENVAVFGQGVVGLLTTALLAQFPLAVLLTLDPFKLRREASRRSGAHQALDPTLTGVEAQISALFESDESKGLADLSFEVSGNPEALNRAIAVTGFNGRIVIGSWYGSKPAALDLGSRFHRRRLRLISSQVSTLTPDLASRWSHGRRFKVAWDMIRRIRPAGFITQRMPFQEARKAYELIDKDPAATIQVILEYENG